MPQGDEAYEGTYDLERALERMNAQPGYWESLSEDQRTAFRDLPEDFGFGNARLTGPLTRPLTEAEQTVEPTEGAPGPVLDQDVRAGIERENSRDSERRARLEPATALATEILGSTDKAHPWLTTANRALGGVSPLALLDSDAGAVAVEQVLGRIAYGIFD